MGLSPNAIDVSLQLNEVRTRFNHLESKLASTLPLLSAAETIATLLSHAEEFGTDHLAKALRENPRHYLLTPEQVESALPLVEELHRLTWDIDLLAGQYNRLMAQVDPTRAPTYYLQNRPFTIDGDDRHMTYADTGERHPIEPPDDDNGRAQQARRKARRRQRDR